MSRARQVTIGGGFLLVLLVVAYAVGRYTAPSTSRTVYKRVEVEVERVVTVGVTSTASADDREKVVVVRVESRPDGTVIEETRLEHRERHEESRTEVEVMEREVEKLVYQDREVLIERDRPRWQVGILAGIDPVGSDYTPSIGARIDYAVLDPITVGVFAFDSGFVGASVGVHF